MAEDGALGVYVWVEGQEHLTSTPVMDVEDGRIIKWHDTEWHDAKDTGKICAHMTVFKLKRKINNTICATQPQRCQGNLANNEPTYPGGERHAPSKPLPPRHAYQPLVGSLPVGTRQMA